MKSADKAVGLVPDSQEKRYPLTNQQYGLWVEWRLHPDNTSYNTCVKLRLDGPLDKDRFEKALRDVVMFFDSLRMYYREEKGIPYQYVKEEDRAYLKYEDISTGAREETEEQKEQAEAFLAENLATPIDLTEFPICRSALIKTTDTRHYFIGLVPHIISDGASAILFLEATSIAYNKGWDGLVEAYGETQKNWDDYFAEATDQDLGQDTEYIDFWRQRLTGAQHTVDFSNNPASDTSSVKSGKRVYFDFTPDLSDRLKKHARQNRTTLFNVLVCIFSILINRYYRHDDLLIGYPVNIRPAGFRHHFGFFVNIIPLRVDMSDNPTYQSLLDNVSKTRKEDRKYQSFPAFDIMKTIRERVPDFDGHVFNVSMAQTVSRLVNLNLDEIVSTPLDSNYNDVNDDISLSYELMEDGRIGLWLEYRLNLFNREIIDLMMQHIPRIAESILENPDTPISDFDLMTSDEVTRVLSDFSLYGQTAQIIERAETQTIYTEIKAQAERTPDAPALISEDGALSYATLIDKVEHRARHLVSKGVQSGDSVVVFTPRGAEQIISILAVMAAGGCYVPVPDDMPGSRVDFIIEDTCSKIVITSTSLTDGFDTQAVQLVYIEDEISDATSTALPIVSKNSPSYIIYTSGSTGKPKGVILKHEHVLPRLEWLRKECPLTGQDRVLQNTSYSFDVSVAEIFWPLTSGAALVMTDAVKYKDAYYLRDLIKEQSVTTSCMVPSLMNALLSITDEDELSSIKLLLSAGEALSPSLAKRFKDMVPDARLLNVYGPTEAAIYASWFDCEAIDESYTKDYVPIGRPLDETTLYILDEKQNPVPPLVAGDLYIGGQGVAVGYLNREDLTDAAFVENPLHADERLYRTGDLAMFESNGDIRFLGRADNQVKVRGYRIELEEIESVIMSVDGVSDSAVIAYGDGVSGQRLVAYYSQTDNDGDIETDIKARIDGKLPPYMMPAFFVALDDIPKTSSGKINRRALPAPEQVMTRSQEFKAPETDIEIKLAEIWADILKVPVDKIGIYDSFFNLGGDSLMAIQFVGAAEAEGLYFKTEALFEYRTISDLSGIMTEEAPDISVPDYELKEDVPLQMLPRQQKFFTDGMANPHYWNRVFYFESSHNAKDKHIKAAFKRVFDLHPGLGSYFKQDTTGMWDVFYKSDIDLEQVVSRYDVTDESDQTAQIVETVNQVQADMRLDNGPLVRVLYFETAPKAGTLVIICHHLLVDIISSRVVFEDFLRAYETQRKKLPVKIQKPQVTPFEWAEALAKSADIGQSQYWAQLPDSHKPALKTNFPVEEDAHHEKHAKLFNFYFDEDITQTVLQDLPRKTGVAVQDILLAAFTETMTSHTGEDEIIVDICGHGRHSQGYDLNRTVGWLNTVYPVCLKKPESADPLSSIKNQLSKVPTDNGMYNVLRYIARDEAILKHPNPQLFFNYISQIDAILPENLPFTPVLEPEGIHSSDLNNALKYLLYVEAAVYEKKLALRVTYSQKIFLKENIEKLCNQIKARIESYVKQVN